MKHPCLEAGLVATTQPTVLHCAATVELAIISVRQFLQPARANSTVLLLKASYLNNNACKKVLKYYTYNFWGVGLLLDCRVCLRICFTTVIANLPESDQLVTADVGSSDGLFANETGSCPNWFSK